MNSHLDVNSDRSGAEDMLSDVATSLIDINSKLGKMEQKDNNDVI